MGCGGNTILVRGDRRGWVWVVVSGQKYHSASKLRARRMFAGGMGDRKIQDRPVFVWLKRVSPLEVTVERRQPWAIVRTQCV